MIKQRAVCSLTNYPFYKYIIQKFKKIIIKLYGPQHDKQTFNKTFLCSANQVNQKVHLKKIANPIAIILIQLLIDFTHQKMQLSSKYHQHFAEEVFGLEMLGI